MAAFMPGESPPLVNTPILSILFAPFDPVPGSVDVLNRIFMKSRNAVPSLFLCGLDLSIALISAMS
jgi:hypothetical protein